MWFHEVLVYHIYPLGFCDAPEYNDFSSSPVCRLETVFDALPSIKALGCNTIYFGPVFESSKHGYDTVDYFHVDRRLGDNSYFIDFVDRLHKEGMRVVLDGVFNHVGRDFWAFYDLRQKKGTSEYVHWFKDVDFSKDNGFGDGFTYRGWEGHDELVELNLENSKVKEHLFQVVEQMVRLFRVDGLRLDVAYALPKQFLFELRSFTEELYLETGGELLQRENPERQDEFWLVGEVIHGDYCSYMGNELLHSVTNYECFKGLYSSHNDGNYFEIAHSFRRFFSGGGNEAGTSGDCLGGNFYNFLDNHDVNRIRSNLREPKHLFPVYALLMTMPGIPSIYYGSEFGIPGSRDESSDAVLRPSWDSVKDSDGKDTALFDFISRLRRIRQESPALLYGDYRELYVDHRQFAFLRTYQSGGGKSEVHENHIGDTQHVLVAVNAADEKKDIEITDLPGTLAIDGFYGEERYAVTEGPLKLCLPPYGASLFFLCHDSRFQN